MFSEETKQCVCSDSIKTYAHCDVTNLTISRYNTSWISTTNESIMIGESCPFDYCNDEPFFVSDPDGQCDQDRSGTLCGDCIQGYSLSLGLSRCLPCAGQVWKLPIILLGSAVAGIGLITLLIALNLTVSVGTINGPLFFVNVVKIYEPVFFFGKNEPVALQYFFSWLNLDLGMSTCFFDGMNACHKVGLQFLFPLYLLFLVLAIVAICRCGQWRVFRSIPWVVRLSDNTVQLMGSKIVPVLATVILFSYTKLIRSVILIYLKEEVQVFECDSAIADCHNSTQWYINGSVEYLTGCHEVLFALGTGVIVPLVSFFTVFLLIFPVMERYLPHFKSWRSWHIRLKPWYDAYGAPYEDKYRFWTGLLLIVRCLLVLTVTVSTNGNLNLHFLMWLCLILIPLVASIKVYKSAVLNVLEVVYLLCILAMVHFFTAKYDIEYYVVSGIFLCFLIAIMFFHSLQRIKSTQAFQLLQQVMSLKKKVSAIEEASVLSKSEEQEGKSWSTSKMATISYSKLREPLLEDSNI